MSQRIIPGHVALSPGGPTPQQRGVGRLGGVTRLSSAPEDTLYFASSDITTTGWSATPGPSFYSAIDEVSINVADYVTSPNSLTPGPLVLGLSSELPAGNWDVSISVKQEVGTGSEVRIVLLNAANSVMGTSDWITATGSFTTTVLPVTTSGTSDKFRLEVQ